MKQALSYLFGVLLIASAAGHIFNPDFYLPMIPDFIPAGLANVLTAIVEAVIGVMLFLPKYRHWGGLGFFLLMLAFLPIHIWDWTKENPMVGPSPAPEIRLAVQLVLIYGGWWIYRKTRPS